MSSKNISDVKVANGNNIALVVSITAQKNPIARGGIQNATITVTDSVHHNPIANAKVDGKLAYPGGNYEKKFEGVTDVGGKFLYSYCW